MTISVTTRVSVAVGNSSATAWPFTFNIPDAASIVVKVYDSATGLTTTIAAADFSATGYGSEAGGTVTYPLVGSPLGPTQTIKIIRQSPLIQAISITKQTTYFADIVMQVWDKLTLADQEISDDAKRALRFPEADATSPELPEVTGRASKILAFDALGALDTNISTVDLSNAAGNAAAAATSAANATTSATSSAADAVATAADRVQTGLDVTASAGSVTAAAGSATNASASETAAAGSATSANTSATSAAGSAAAASISEGNASGSETASATSETNAAGNATAAVNSASASSISAIAASTYAAAAAGSAADINIAALSGAMTYTPVDTVVGRMADWSDGGFNMRVIQPSLSWYNESTTAIGSWLGEATNEAAARLILGAGTDSYYHNLTDGKFYSLNATTGHTEVFRGHKAGFPEEYVVVAGAGRVIIFDATEPGQPMWMVFVGGVGRALHTIAGSTSVVLFNGKIVVGIRTASGGYASLDLLADYQFLQQSSASSWNGARIVDRNLATSDFQTGLGAGIVNTSVNDVAITVLPDAPIDLTTGMPVPTIAVATDGGVSQIGWDGVGIDNVWDITGFAPASVVSISGNTLILSGSNGVTYGSMGPLPVTADITEISWRTTNINSGGGAIFTPASAGWLATNSRSVRNIRMFGGVSGIIHLFENPTTPAKGMVNYMNSTYLSGWMPGDIRGAWLADTTAETITGAELVTDGGMNTASTLAVPSAYWKFNNGIGDINTTTAGKLHIIAGVNGYMFNIGGQLCDKSKVYVIEFEITASTANVGVRVGFYTVSGTSLGYLNSGTYYTAVGKYVVTIPAGLSLQNFVIGFFRYSGHTGTVDIDNVSVRLADPDRSVKANGLQVFGSLTKAPVATGSDLVAYSGFSATNYLQQPYNPALDFGTGDFSYMLWFKTSNVGSQTLFSRADSLLSPTQFRSYISAGQIATACGSGSSSLTDGISYSDGTYHFLAVVRAAGVEYIYVDANKISARARAGSVTNAAANLNVGVLQDYSAPLTGGSLALPRISATVPSADQIKYIYETEKVLFQDNAKCTLYGTSDAVTDLAYDEILGTTGVLTSAGLSRFDGLVRTSYTAGSFSKVSMNNNLEVLI